MDLKAVFIRNLKYYRKIRGVSQMKLADLCDSSTAYIGQIEIGSKFPSIGMIARMAEALDIKPYLLFVDESGADGLPESPPPPPWAMPEAVKESLVRDLGAAIRRVIRRQ